MTDVLLIDDDNDEFKIVSDAIRHFPEPIRCIYANSAENALEILKNFQPYMILVDMNMPVINGIECIKKIILIKKGPTPIIVLYPARMDAQLCQSAKEAGASNCFEKTSSKENLIEELSPFLSIL